MLYVAFVGSFTTGEPDSKRRFADGLLVASTSAIAWMGVMGLLVKRDAMARFTASVLAAMVVSSSAMGKDGCVADL